MYRVEGQRAYESGPDRAYCGVVGVWPFPRVHVPTSYILAGLKLRYGNPFKSQVFTLNPKP